MRILFPSFPITPTQPDPDYEAEYAAAQTAGFVCSLYELESLRNNDLRTALKHCRPATEPNEVMIYRGWMVSDTQYETLYNGLVERSYQPLTRPAAYAEAHYLPRAYPKLQGLTPHMVWMEGSDGDRAWNLYQQVAHEATILKDYVKSAKHRWREACFLPAHTTRSQFDAILQAFLRERGPLFEKGLLFRRYHPLVQLGEDMRGQPIHEEYRLFCLDGKIIAHVPFRDPMDLLNHQHTWEALAARFTNRFITLDVARQSDDTWIVVEAGDGGVSGLPLSIDPADFYRALWHALAQML